MEVKESEQEEFGNYSTYHNLLVWRKAHGLVMALYPLLRCFPTEERFGLVSQIRRAAVSVPANIAESHGRYSRKDQMRFLHIARGSLYELSYLVELSAELGYLEGAELQSLLEKCAETGRLLNGLIRKKRESA